MLERLGGDEALARQLAAIFVAECPRMLGAVHAAVDAGSPQMLQTAAHAFKGSIGNFTDTAPTTTAFELELMGRDRRMDRAAAVYAKLTREVEAFLDQLRHFGAL
jgi:HPt (histidine-containing phosphotransfer) domain-containing protein